MLIVYAHQEPRSFNATLKNVAVEELSKQGCSVTVSDLYAMGFEPRATRIDITGEAPWPACFLVKLSSSHFIVLKIAFEKHTRVLGQESPVTVSSPIPVPQPPKGARDSSLRVLSEVVGAQAIVMCVTLMVVCIVFVSLL